MIANAAKKLIRNRLAQTTFASSPLSAEWVEHTDHTTLSEIFQLRYKVLVTDAKTSKRGCLFPPDHFCIKGDEFRDDYDYLPSTGHLLIRHNGRAVASTRIVNGNHVPLEAEHYNWHDVFGVPYNHSWRMSRTSLSLVESWPADRSVVQTLYL